MSAGHDPAADLPLGDQSWWGLWHFTAGVLWIVFGLCLIIFAGVIPGEDEPMTAVGLLILALALVCMFIGVRRVRAVFFLEVTRAQIKEHDLWRGERLLLIGGLLLGLPAILADQLLGFTEIAGADAFVVMIALMVIGPVSFWAGPNWGVLWEIRKVNKEAKKARRVAAREAKKARRAATLMNTSQDGSVEEEAPEKPSEDRSAAKQWTPGTEAGKPITMLDVAITGWLVADVVLRELRKQRGR